MVDAELVQREDDEDQRQRHHVDHQRLQRVLADVGVLAVGVGLQEEERGEGAEEVAQARGHVLPVELLCPVHGCPLRWGRHSRPVFGYAAPEVAKIKKTRNQGGPRAEDLDMELVNKTPLSARILTISADESDDDLDALQVAIVAKATFCVDAHGRVGPDLDEPVPILLDDLPTPRGLLPRDDLPPPAERFQVIFLGSAHAPDGRAVREMQVALTVGRTRRALRVTGDRSWCGVTGLEAHTTPRPFLRMPLTWSRAFGGTCEVQVDRGAVVPVSHHLNPEGRGFDPRAQAEALAGRFRCPGGYPCFAPDGPLPNIERPEQRITSRSDAPDPVCWATLPPYAPLHLPRAEKPAEKEDPVAMLERLAGEPLPGALPRAHPDWNLPQPPFSGAHVALEGLTPGPPLRFELPRLRVLADLIASDEAWTVELLPRLLVLLGDEGRFYLVFRADCALPYWPGEERGARLRLAEGRAQPRGGEGCA